MERVQERLVGIEADGLGSPMPHANLLDNSLNLVPPLRRLERVTHLPRPAVCSINFGAYTGENFALCVFESAEEPPLVAISLETDEVLWSLPLDVLPGTPVRRWMSGVLMAKLHFGDGSIARRIYVANRAEMICADHQGRIRWRRSSEQLVGRYGEALGLVRCVRYTPDCALVITTSHGQVLKVDPLTGETLELCLLESEATVAGQRVRGRYTVMQSPILAGRTIYVEAAFTPHDPALHDHPLRPVALLRLTLGPDGIRPLAEPDADGSAPDRIVVGLAGDDRQGGSPSAILDAEGWPVAIVNAYQQRGVSALRWGLRCIRDRAGELEELWRAEVTGVADTNIAAAPAFDPLTGIYLAPTRGAMLIVKDAAMRRGVIEPDAMIPAKSLLAPDVRQHCVDAELSSPLSLARDGDEGKFVCYAAMAVMTPYDERPYSFLTAFEVVPDALPEVRPIWSGSLALGADGEPAPAVRSFGQPALFRYGPAKDRTGIVMGSCFDGIAVFR